MGGIHASMMPEEALKFVDSVVIGEAEGVWPEVIAHAEAGDYQEVIRPYPGTRLFERLLKEGRLFHTDFPSDWDRCDLTEILFKPRRL